ncbi:hypothetical protein CG08_0942 [Riemerella anatipestifer]|nr:hypothetical protein G148_0775 [Riemerella anatipestifer RA-CH-2]AKP69235.1 hypothetical protein CG08_0942 [Riemerella anatipestifer]
MAQKEFMKLIFVGSYDTQTKQKKYYLCSVWQQRFSSIQW